MKKRKDGLYTIRVYCGKEGGKSKYKSVYAKTPAEVRKKAAELQVKINKGFDVLNTSSFGYYKNKWLRFKKAEVSERYYMGLESNVKHLEPLYNMNIADIKPSDIKEIINALAEENPYTGKPTSKKVLQDVRRNCEQIFNEAIDDRVIDYNPALRVKIPSSAPKSEREAIDEEQIKWITETPHTCQTAAMIMLYAGLRKSEVGALMRKDIDLDAGTIRVNKHIEFVKNQAYVRNTTKTKAGDRLVTIPQILIDYLAQLPMEHRYIAFDTDEPVNVNFWQTKWKSYMIDLDFKYGVRLKKAKSKYDPNKGQMVIKPFTIHQLRHTYATMLYNADVDLLTAQYLLGHDDAKTTLSIYTHLTNTQKARSIEKLNIYLAG